MSKHREENLEQEEVIESKAEFSHNYRQCMISSNDAGSKPDERSRQSVKEKALEASVGLARWLEANGWAGYDPYDIRGTGWYRRMAEWRGLAERALRKAPLTFIQKYPLAARWLITEKTVNPKAMGLFVAAFCRLYQTTGNQAYLEKAESCAQWLLENNAEQYPGLSWGYPFDWQSVVFIPKGTPSVVVSATVGDGFFLLAQLTENKNYYDACRQICNFILNGLSRTEIDSETFCFSYTPIDQFLVHNANLLGAEFLARTGSLLDEPEWCAIGACAGNYALREQNEDGSLHYWGKLQNAYAPNHLDCYHSGFEIRSLWGLGKATGDKRFQQAALNYYDCFSKLYIGNNGEVMTLPNTLFPVDIHACAEALLCPAVLHEANPDESLDIISRVLPWTVNLMRNPNGSFAYMAFEDGQVDRTPYIRWGQAWMLRALAEVQFVLERNQSEVGD